MSLSIVSRNIPFHVIRGVIDLFAAFMHIFINSLLAFVVRDELFERNVSGCRKLPKNPYISAWEVLL